MSQVIRLRVNGQVHEADLEPDMPLLYFLRNDLALNGPKYGCGVQQCGACMVLLNGEAQPSCVIPVDRARQYEIETLESFGTADRPHPLQRAFVEEQAAQCGYCLNGGDRVCEGVARPESFPPRRPKSGSRWSAYSVVAVPTAASCGRWSGQQRISPTDR